MRELRLVAAAFAVVVTVAACGSPDDSGRAEPTSSTPSSTSSQEPVVDEDTGETIAPEVVPTWDDESRSSASAAAEEAMRLYARPNVSEQRWFDDLSPLMTQQAQQDYAYVYPESIVATSVTGPGVIVDDTSAYVVHVSVPTDVGAYVVLLIRQDGASPWRISKFTPPEGIY